MSLGLRGPQAQPLGDPEQPHKSPFKHKTFSFGDGSLKFGMSAPIRLWSSMLGRLHDYGALGLPGVTLREPRAAPKPPLQHKIYSFEDRRFKLGM